VAPPRRGAAQPEQACGLGGDAVRRHELLLLAERAEKAERMQAEAEHAEQAEREQAGGGGERHAHACARAAGAEHQEWEHDARAQLHPDARHKRRGARAGTRRRAHREGQRAGEREHEQRVVVRPTDGQHQQHRVQPDESGRPRGRAPQARSRACGQRDRAEARGGGEALEEPQPAGEPQRRCDVAREREQRAVGRVLEGPADESEGGIGGGFCGDVRVRVEAVQGPHPREGEVAEHVLGDQRRAQHEDHVREHDRPCQRERRQRARCQQHEQVAAAHHEHQQLKRAAAETRAEARERPGQPIGPAAYAGRDVLGGTPGCARVEQQDRHEHPHQGEPADRAHQAGRDARRPPPGLPARCAFEARLGYGSRGLDDAHCYVCPSCKAPI
jgi:hypothetical protein